MKTATLIACLCLATPASLAVGQQHNPNAQAQHAAEPVNTMCPIGKEPIVKSAGTVEYKGKAIGICCPGCGMQFLAWDDTRKDEFIVLAVAGREPGTANHGDDADEADTQVEAEAWTDLYSLDTCPISGEKLGSMGDPIVNKYDGREVRFCCDPCIGMFEADLAASWKKVDEAIVKDQMRYYALDTCVVSGEPLVENDKDIGNDIVYGNRLVRLCCTMCEREFKADPKKYIIKLDKATAEAQRKDYPLNSCVVAGARLGSMGQPTEMIVAGRLLRFCCASCEPRVKSDPAKFITEIDKAWQAKGRFMPEGPNGD